MKFLVVQQWPSTQGNHAGMVHMCDMLVERYPAEYAKLEVDATIDVPPRKSFLARQVLSRWQWWSLSRRFVADFLRRHGEALKSLKAGDTVYLLEYHLPAAGQLGLARYFRSRYPGVRIVALSHLMPSIFGTVKLDAPRILEWERLVDVQMTLGSSLSRFFESLGVPAGMVSTGYHYVDADYYHRSAPRQRGGRLKAIAMGNLKRNFDLLRQVVELTPDVDWVICCGRNKLDSLFENCGNVNLQGYVDEDTLKGLMEQADVSVNIFDDTIGSNVITTSMAMELALVVSDVGSIRDYCTEDNAVFCKNEAEDLAKAINALAHDGQKVAQMQESSLSLSKKFRIGEIHRWFCSLQS